MESIELSDALKRIYWPFREDTSPSTISVMNTPRIIGNLEPFFRSGERSDGAWHDIASLPATNPRVSSLEVTFKALDHWESNWVAFHSCHDDAEYITYRYLSDEDRPYAKEQKEDGSWEENSDTEFLICCCGEDRPRHKRGLKLQVQSSTGNDFVTVLDYVNTVHGWLMGLREDILRSKAVTHLGLSIEAVKATDWMVSTSAGPNHDIEVKKDWERRRQPRRTMDAAAMRFANRIGARIAQ